VANIRAGNEALRKAAHESSSNQEAELLHPL
jgi:hypothetical protein